MFPEDFFGNCPSESPTRSAGAKGEPTLSPSKRLSLEDSTKPYRYWNLRNEMEGYRMGRDREPGLSKRGTLYSEKKQRIAKLKPERRPFSQVAKKWSIDPAEFSFKKSWNPELSEGLITFFGKSRTKCLALQLPPIK
jgi:hypothetical protein